MPSPAIDCLLVAPAGWPPVARRAVADFAAQGHPARRLWAVVATAADAAIFAVLAPAGGVLIAAGGAAALPALAAAGDGDLVALWDARTRHHPDRLEAQLSWLDPTFVGVALSAQLALDEHLGRLWWLDMARGTSAGCGDRLPETLLCRREALAGPWPTDVPPAPRPFAAAARAGAIVALTDWPWLCAATGAASGWRGAVRRHGATAAALGAARRRLTRGLAPWREDYPRLVVCDHTDTPVFTLGVAPEPGDQANEGEMA